MPKTVLPAPVKEFFDATEGQVTLRERVTQFQQKFPERSFGADAAVWLFATVPMPEGV